VAAPASDQTVPNTALIPVYAGRPPIVVKNGVVVYISLHDQEHFRLRSKWRHRFRVHPDTGGVRASASFLQVRQRYESWLAKERKWYAHYGLDLPHHRDAVFEPFPRKPRKTSLLSPKTIEDRELTRRERVQFGLCRECGTPRGELGTHTMCRPCANRHSDRERQSRVIQGRKYFRKVKARNPAKVPRRVVGIWASEEEARVWQALAKRFRVPVAKLVKQAMRAAHKYVITVE